MMDKVTMDSATISALAKELDVAEKTRTPVRHFSKRYPEMTIDDGYAIQTAWVNLKMSQGRKALGHKIGLTSRAMQLAANITEPDFGTLLDDMFFPEGSDIPLDRFIAPKVEVELAFILKKKLEGTNVSIFDVLNATDYVVPSIEIIDARIERVDRDTKVQRKVFDTISDNAANAGILTGGKPVRPDTVDLRWCAALLYKNGVIEETGVAAGVLNHPATGVAWLANRLGARGVALEAGEVVLAGSFTRPVDVARGDVFHADYGPLGNIAFRFV